MTPLKGRGFLDRLPMAYARRMARWFARRRFSLSAGAPLITFTFDDFPRTALTAGGAILEEAGARGSYFVAMGLESQTIATGRMFSAADLNDLLGRGHELGCHTYHHYPAWETSTADYESSVDRNAVALAELPQAIQAQIHSYPISYPRPASKRRIARRFRGCRAGGQAPNRGTVDLNYLNSFFIEQSVGDFGAIERVIAENIAQGGWLIFSTHDVTDSHTRFGCSPAFFAKVVRAARNSGAEIKTMSKALDDLGVPNLGP